MFTNYIGKILAFSDHLLPYVYVFYGIKVDKKWTFLDHLPTSSCKRSLWTPPYVMLVCIEVLVVGYRVQINRFGPTDYLRWEARSQTMAHYSNKAKMFKKFIKSGSEILQILEWRRYDTFFETTSHFSFTATDNKVLKKRAYKIVVLVLSSL